MANFLFVLGVNDNTKATRCFQFAKIAVEKGHGVDVFLVDDGVMWADSTRNLKTATLTGDCPGDYLPYLVEHEVPIGVWIPCAKSRQVDENNFFSNMVLDGAPRLIDIAADASVFNFDWYLNFEWNFMNFSLTCHWLGFVFVYSSDDKEW